MDLGEIHKNTYFERWQKAAKQARFDAAVGFSAAEARSNRWKAWTPTRPDEEPPWIQVAKGLVANVILAELPHIGEFADDVDQANGLADASIYSAASEIIRMAQRYVHRIPSGNRFAVDDAARQLADDVAVLVEEDRIKILNEAMNRVPEDWTTYLRNVPGHGALPLAGKSGPAQGKRRSRTPLSVTSPKAATKLADYLGKRGITQTQFSIEAKISQRTVGTFLKTGRVKIKTFDAIAAAMGTTKENLLTD